MPAGGRPAGRLLLVDRSGWVPATLVVLVTGWGWCLLGQL
jgi:hypothetical protein